MYFCFKDLQSNILQPVTSNSSIYNNTETSNHFKYFKDYDHLNDTVLKKDTLNINSSAALNDTITFMVTEPKNRKLLHKINKTMHCMEMNINSSELINDVTLNDTRNFIANGCLNKTISLNSNVSKVNVNSNSSGFVISTETFTNTAPFNNNSTQAPTNYTIIWNYIFKNINNITSSSKEMIIAMGTNDTLVN